MAFEGLGAFRVGVVIPTYNAESYLRECLESVLSQSHPPVHIIICDDCSIDGTKKIISEYENNYQGLIEGVFHEDNVGMSANFNSGLMKVRGDYVSLISGDDLWHKDKLYLEAKLIHETGAEYAFSKVARLDNGKIIENSYDEDIPTELPFDYNFLVLQRKVFPRNALIKKSLIRDVGYFNENGIFYSDWDLAIKYTYNIIGCFVPSYNTYRRIHDSSATFSVEVNNKGCEFLYRIMEVLYLNSKIIDSYDKKNIEDLSVIYEKTIISNSQNMEDRLCYIKSLLLYFKVFRPYLNFTKKLKLIKRLAF